MDFDAIVKILTKYGPSLWLGVQNTLLVALVGTIVGLVIGLVIGGLKAIKVDSTASSLAKVVKKIYDIFATIYIEVFRGTPMMVQALFIYYALLKIFNWTPIVAGMFVISINTGAYMSEIIRAGIQSVDKGQTEAARSLGMSNIQTMLLVILPQAVKNAFPAIGNEFIVNIKDSSVLSVITLTELMFQANRIAGSVYKFPETYFVTACIYLILTVTMSFILHIIEGRLSNTRTSYPHSDSTSSSVVVLPRNGKRVK